MRNEVLLNQLASQANKLPANCRASPDQKHGPRKNSASKGKQTGPFDCLIATALLRATRARDAPNTIR
jgi:hypothetical protein